MMMKPNTLRFCFVMLAVVCVLVAMAGPAQADVLRCKNVIDTVQLDLDHLWNNTLNSNTTDPYGVIGGGNPDQTYKSLTSKLQDAKVKLDQGKNEDARRKLQDFKDAVILMRDAAKPKLTQKGAELLLDGNKSDDYHVGVNGALECVLLL